MMTDEELLKIERDHGHYPLVRSMLSEISDLKRGAARVEEMLRGVVKSIESSLKKGGDS